MSKTTWTYTFITFLFTWSIVLVAYGLYQSGSISRQQLDLVYNLGALGPLAGGLLCAWIFYGRQGVKKLLVTFNFKTLNRKSLLISLSPLVFLFIGLLIYPVMAGHWYTFADTKKQFGLDTSLSYWCWIMPFITYAVFEEFGWRGFLLPHLQEKYSAFKSSFILTLFWASWHLPFFLWRFEFSPVMMMGFFLSIFVGSIVLTSAFNLSNGSIVTTIIFHLCNNLASALDKEYIVTVISSGFVVLAYYLLRNYGTLHLSDRARVKNIYVLHEKS